MHTYTYTYTESSSLVIAGDEAERQLFFAAWRGRLDDVLWTIGLGATGCVEMPEYGGQTALSKSMSLGYHDIVQAIQNAGIK